MSKPVFVLPLWAIVLMRKNMYLNHFRIRLVQILWRLSLKFATLVLEVGCSHQAIRDVHMHKELWKERDYILVDITLVQYQKSVQGRPIAVMHKQSCFY